MTRDGVKKAL